MSSRKQSPLVSTSIFFGCILFIILLVCFPSYGIEGMRAGIGSCYNRLIPSLFPFMLVCNLLSCALARHSRTSGQIQIIFAIFLGMIGGFPVGAATLANLVRQKRISPRMASLLLCGCVNAGPAFLVGTVGVSLFGNQIIGLFLFLSLSFASLCCIALAALFLSGNSGNASCPVVSDTECSLSAAMKKSILSIATLCGYVLFFSCLLSYIEAFLNLVNLENPIVSWLVHALLEVTSGCETAALIPGSVGALCACAGISFCGISIVLQIKGILSDTGISLRYFWLFRPLHCLISVLMTRALLVRFEHAVETMAGTASPDSVMFCLSPAFSLAAFLLCAASLCADRAGFGFTNKKN